MTKKSKPDISRSADQHSLRQYHKYVERKQQAGETISEEYLDFFNKILDRRGRQFDDPSSRENNLEWDLLTTDWILDKVRASENYAQNLYAALCNNEFQLQQIWPMLKNQRWSCSWRYAGGIIADMRGEGDYMDWYCSGLRGGDEPDVYDLPLQRGVVPESEVTEEIHKDLIRLGWRVCDDADQK